MSASSPEVVRILRLPHAPDVLPQRMTPGAAGFDLHAAARQVLAPAERAVIPTGIRIELPPLHEAQVRPRSGLARRHGITVLNAPGTIDSDYRGEVEVLLVNHGASTYTVEPGDRIAQLVIANLPDIRLAESAALSGTDRGGRGFGSTGR